jgi:hypothetical protein
MARYRSQRGTVHPPGRARDHVHGTAAAPVDVQMRTPAGDVGQGRARVPLGDRLSAADGTLDETAPFRRGCCAKSPGLLVGRSATGALAGSVRGNAPSRRRSGRLRGAGEPPELEEVVRGGDQAPFCAAGGQASSLESVGAADGLGVREDGLDDL